MTSLLFMILSTNANLKFVPPYATDSVLTVEDVCFFNDYRIVEILPNTEFNQVERQFLYYDKWVSRQVETLDNLVFVHHFGFKQYGSDFQHHLMISLKPGKYIVFGRSPSNGKLKFSLEDGSGTRIKFGESEVSISEAISVNAGEFGVYSCFRAKNSATISAGEIRSLEDMMRQSFSNLNTEDFDNVLQFLTLLSRVDAARNRTHNDLWGDPAKAIDEFLAQTSDHQLRAVLNGIKVKFGKREGKLPYLRELVAAEMQDPGCTNNAFLYEMVRNLETNSGYIISDHSLEKEMNSSVYCSELLDMYMTTREVNVRRAIASSLLGGYLPEFRERVLLAVQSTPSTSLYARDFFWRVAKWIGADYLNIISTEADMDAVKVDLISRLGG